MPVRLGRSPAPEAMLTMRPNPPRFMCGATACEHQNAPCTLASNSTIQSCSPTSSSGRPTCPRTPPAQFVPVALFKVFVHPLIVLAAGLLLNGAGVAVPGFGLMVLVLAAALPSASNVSLLAERFEADNGRVARIIMTSTVIAFASFSALAWLLGVQAAT